ncbi:hypothetical protein PsorP6_006774 [Peronosclerospora sorghi]|uniref:Uncharacterized protein n=1 Tax=Peronosclerospora sorghi TaxID=230839 RepID=A0ACC0W3R9_9STRA|nr:hypothetical protein PsorP6_006774 [Peronosclerospora sorghi]
MLPYYMYIFQLYTPYLRFRFVCLKVFNRGVANIIQSFLREKCLVSSDDDIWKREKTGKRFIRNDPARPIRVKVRAFLRLQTRRDQRNQFCLVLDHSPDLSCRLSCHGSC